MKDVIFVSGQVMSRLALLIMLLCLGAKAVGVLQVQNAVLEGSDLGCRGETRPCWQGIMPGITMIGEAREVVEALGYQPYNGGVELSDRVFMYRATELAPGCVDLYYVPGTGKMESISLRCMVIRAGDILLGFGAPTQRWGILDATEALYYPTELVAAFARKNGRLTVNKWVAVIYVRAGHNNLFNPPLAVPWRGFAPQWRYCQWEVDYPPCRLGK